MKYYGECYIRNKYGELLGFTGERLTHSDGVGAQQRLLEEIMPRSRLSMGRYYQSKVSEKNISKTERQKIPGDHVQKLKWLLS